ncbi:MAG: PD-(D/E)XK nuclease family protein [Ilumatobacteraceae bacterium]|nr:PD-(D/E)XK nuclease family protein [Acidimicrobiales bacterium]MCB9393744.1 PD-(D/E)XK nuclease family protein [Acidimicrobiaceae bacterium]
MAPVADVPHVEVRWTAPGRALASAVGQAIRDLQFDDPLRLVRVIAPDGATVDGLRRALPLNGGSCGAEIGGTLRLANEIASHELGRRRVAPDVAVLAVVQQLLGDPRTRPAPFATCADHPATHDAIVRTYASLVGAFTLDDDPVAALHSLAAGRDSATAVVRLVAQVRDRLLRQGLVDTAEIVRIATRRLRDLSVAGDEVGAAPVVLVVTQQFNPSHVAMLQALIARSPRSCVVATTSPAPELGVAPHVARLVQRDVVAVQHQSHERDVVVVSCPDHDEEVREVTRRIVGLLERGVVADRIAVFYPPAGPHRAAIAASLAAAGVAARGQVAPQLKGSVAGQVLRLLLALVRDGLDRHTLVELARLAPTGRDVEVDEHGAEQVRTFARPADRWNRLAQRHGVVGERDWAAFDARLPDDDHRDHRAHRALTGFVRRQRHHRDTIRAAADWPEVARALEAWFVTHCGTVEWRLEHWVGYPAWQREAAEQLEGVFAVLAEIEQFGLPLRTSVLVRLVEAFLDTDVVTSESKGAGVFVDQIVGATGAVFDHAFVVGANDHLLPGRVSDDLVLTRHHGAEPLGVLTGPANRPRRDERGLHAALEGATESVTLTWSRWDVRSGGDLYPSPLIAHATLRREHVASHAARMLDIDAPWLDTDEWFTRHPDRSTPRLARRRRAITSRLQPHPGEYDGQVGPLGATHPFARLGHGGEPVEVGITSFEQWVTCGLEYFVTRVLDARVDDTDPSEITDIEAREKGTLVHEVFERLIVEWIDAHPGSTGPWIDGPDDVERTMARLEEILDELAAPLLTAHHLGHPEMWRARRAQVLRAMRRGIEYELDDRVTPIGAEFSFGRRSDGRRPPATWTSPDGRHRVAFNGSIDRVDRQADGSLRVMDLKSGRAEPFAKIDPLHPLGPDRDKLQLAFYGWAVEQLTGEPVTRSAYRFVGRPEAAADVVLGLTPDVHEQLHARLHEIADAIDAGRFEPGEVGTWGCDVCAPDGLGTYEINQRRIEWSGEAEVVDGLADRPTDSASDDS